LPPGVAKTGELSLTAKLASRSADWAERLHIAATVGRLPARASASPAFGFAVRMTGASQCASHGSIANETLIES
jgi:hypothetical protein